MKYNYDLNEYILSYESIMEKLYALYSKNQDVVRMNIIGYSTFGYSIKCYKVGKGKKHVVLLGATHGCELVTTKFLFELYKDLLDSKGKALFSEFTFHFIPILNPEGYIISSSNVLANMKCLKISTCDKLEQWSKLYLKNYNDDDKIASKGIKCPKKFYHVFNNSCSNIDNVHLRNSVNRILVNCCLNEKVLSVWAANGMGVDLNSNSIDCFFEMKKLRNQQKYANLRYNDIPVTKPSPMSYPGVSTFCNCPENYSLDQYIKGLYYMNENDDVNEKFIAIFSYHSTGGEIYSYPKYQVEDKFYKENMQLYSRITGYRIIDDQIKYGIMDYYRRALKNTLCLTIELSKLNANPIGPFSDLDKLEDEFVKNKEAMIAVINHI